MIVKDIYQGYWDKHKMENYYYSIKRDKNDILHKLKSNKTKSLAK